MVELIIKGAGEGPFKQGKMEELVNEGPQYRKMYFRGDIIRCTAKGYHKFIDLPMDQWVLQVWTLKWYHNERRIFTEYLWGDAGRGDPEVIGRRRYYIDLDNPKLRRKFKRKRVVRVWSLKNLIKDKEE